MTVWRQDVPPEPESQRYVLSCLRHFISLLTAFPRPKSSIPKYPIIEFDKLNNPYSDCPNSLNIIGVYNIDIKLVNPNEIYDNKAPAFN